jgi:hypothetical protein
MGVALMVLAAAPAMALAQDRNKKEETAATEEAAKLEYSREFRKLASKAQDYANDKKWAELLAALPEIEALPSLSTDEKKVLATWRLQAAQGTGDQDAFAAAIEDFLKAGFAAPDQIGAMHRQLAAHYSNKQDKEKTLHHFRELSLPANFEWALVQRWRGNPLIAHGIIDGRENDPWPAPFRSADRA